ncbi:MAG: 3'-5' exoribonuclease [Prevotella sp.]|nr:3'-5' exoribonuclease [Prevotella sp.]
MLRNFVAIDFETANMEPSSVCSVGAVMVRNGQVADSFYSLIQPEPNYYNYCCQRVHGLSRLDTDDAPVFSKVWQQLERRIADVFQRPVFPLASEPVQACHQPTDELATALAASSVPFVAHNARFDEGCLKAVFKVYQMDYPDYCFYDTLTASRRQFGRSLPNHQLQTVAAACGYDLQHHHHALADAEACAAIALYIL